MWKRFVTFPMLARQRPEAIFSSRRYPPLGHRCGTLQTMPKTMSLMKRRPRAVKPLRNENGKPNRTPKTNGGPRRARRRRRNERRRRRTLNLPTGTPTSLQKVHSIRKSPQSGRRVRIIARQSLLPPKVRRGRRRGKRKSQSEKQHHPTLLTPNPRQGATHYLKTRLHARVNRRRSESNGRCRLTKLWLVWIRIS